MVDIILFSLLELASGFAPNLTSLLVLRALFGIAMGGEWGIGASLVMESDPGAGCAAPSRACSRAAIRRAISSPAWSISCCSTRIGWRGMFMVGVVPALLVLLIRLHVQESPVFEARRGKPRVNPFAELLRHWKIALYLVVLMTAFNFFSHGTQDLYPTFLQKQHHFDTHTTGTLTAIMNVGAIVGGIGFGIWSETDRPQARDHHRQPARAAGHSAMGLHATPLLLGARRLPDAGRGAGRVGHRAGASQRAFAAARARACSPASPISSAI